MHKNCMLYIETNLFLLNNICDKSVKKFHNFLHSFFISFKFTQ